MKNLISNVVDGEATMGWAGVSYPHGCPIAQTVHNMYRKLFYINHMN